MLFMGNSFRGVHNCQMIENLNHSKTNAMLLSLWQLFSLSCTLTVQIPNLKIYMTIMVARYMVYTEAIYVATQKGRLNSIK